MGDLLAVALGVTVGLLICIAILLEMIDSKLADIRDAARTKDHDG